MSEKFHAILSAPGKLIIVLAIIASGGGGLSVVDTLIGSHDAKLAECRLDVERHLATIAAISTPRAVANVRRMESLDSNVDVSSMLGAGRVQDE